MSTDLHDFVDDIRACQLCKADMERAPRPILQVSKTAKILIAGQAPGNLAMESGRPFTDPSGVRLREWLQIDEAYFYDPNKVAIVPMGFCFPGYDAKKSDLPPRKECVKTWHDEIFQQMTQLELILVIGQYAQAYHMGDARRRTLTETVANWRETFTEERSPKILPLPHPSWRNNAWIKQNMWFADELLPELKSRVSELTR